MTDTDLRAFDRYREIVPDYRACVDALRTPLPTSIWTNTLRTTPERVAARLAEEGIEAEPVAWYPGAFRLPAEVSPGTTIAFKTGWYHVQEEVAMLPTMLLDVLPEHRVLDTCAAPGNKTAQIAVMMQNRGTVVANDRSYGRMNAARTAFERLGLLNICTTTHDAATFPDAAGPFDRILADVPCSCEGTSRKHPQALARSSPENALRMHRLQVRILRRAVALCKPGGRIVYATCTYAPEENEAVIHELLREQPGLRLRPVATPGFTASPGLTEWEGQSFHPDLRHALRIWPHQNDTGGFFIAVMEKDDGRATTDERQPKKNRLQTPDAGRRTSDAGLTPVSKEERAALISLMADRFGMAVEAWEPFVIFRESVRFVSIAPKGMVPPVLPVPHSVGLPFIRTNIKYPKLRTGAAIAFGSFATRNLIPLDAEQARQYLSRQPFVLTDAQARHAEGTGYVLLRYDDTLLGLGFYNESEQAVGSLFPKAWALAG